MSEVKIYGAETSRYEYFKYALETFLNQYDLDLKLTEIKDVSKIIEDNVQSIPTLRINSHVDVVYNEVDGIDQFVVESKESIMKEFAPDLLTRILVPIDFSEPSLNAFMYALELGKEIGAEIEVLHVNHPSPVVVDHHVIVDEVDIANKKYNLDSIVDRTKADLSRLNVDSEFVAIKSTFLTGLASNEITRISKEKDLVVMGTTGESLGKKLLGSVSLSVSGSAHCPTLFIPDGKNFDDISKIVYAYAPTSYDQKVLHNVADLARKFDAEVHIVHVNDGTPFEPYDISSYVEHMHDDVKFVCEEIEAGSVSTGINNYSNRLEADLIILSKKKKGILESLFTRSETKSTLKQHRIPTMVYHSNDIGCLCGGACRRKPDSKCSH